MINFQEIKNTVQAQGLRHMQQISQFDCSRTCLFMLIDLNKVDIEIPPIIPTSEMPLYAARYGVYLEPVNPISTGVPHGFLLCLRRNHWFILQINDFDVIVYDPLRTDILRYSIESIPPEYSDDISVSFIVHFAAMPQTGDTSL